MLSIGPLKEMLNEKEALVDIRDEDAWLMNMKAVRVSVYFSALAPSEITGLCPGSILESLSNNSAGRSNHMLVN